MTIKMEAQGKLTDLEIVQSQSLSMIVQREIMRLIMEGHFKVGERLTEAEVADLLGVSRGPVREAFRALEGAGLVQQSKNRGVSVRQISPHQARELYEVRSVLDEMVGRLLAPKITDEQLRELDERIDEMERLAHGGDHSTYYEKNIGFHLRIVAMVNNEKLLDIYGRLMNEMQLMRHIHTMHTLVLEKGSTFSIPEHRDIRFALATRDPDIAGPTMRDHVLRAKERVLLKMRVAASQAKDKIEQANS